MFWEKNMIYVKLQFLKNDETLGRTSCVTGSYLWRGRNTDKVVGAGAKILKIGCIDVSFAGAHTKDHK